MSMREELKQMRRERNDLAGQLAAASAEYGRLKLMTQQSHIQKLERQLKEQKEQITFLQALIRKVRG